MLRITPSSSANSAIKYFRESLSRGDYYLEEQAVKSYWSGKAAEQLRLEGEVRLKEFTKLCCNQKPDGSKLTQRRSRTRVGYDFTFSMPKSVSVVQQYLQDERILEVFDRAVASTMQQIESKMQARVRAGGANEDRITGNMVYATFRHAYARPVADQAPDPHWHSHVFVMNVTWDEAEQKWKAGQFHDVMVDRPYYQSLFHHELAKGLHQIGYATRRTDKGFELAGFNDALVRKFSKRTQEIENEAASSGVDSAREKAGLGARTRQHKQNDLDEKTIRQNWWSQLESFERDALEKLRYPSREAMDDMDPDIAASFAVKHCFEKRSVVRYRELKAAALQFGLGRIDVAAMDDALGQQGIVVRDSGSRQMATTHEVLRQEQELLDVIRCGRGKHAPISPSKLEWRTSLFRDDSIDTKQQEVAVTNILHSRDRFYLVEGRAGTGKTTLLEELSHQIGITDLKLYAFAPTTKARDGLDEAMGKRLAYPASTLAHLRYNSPLQKDLCGQVVVVDEAALTDIRDMAMVAELAKQNNETRVVLVGDTRQHEAPGGRTNPVILAKKHAGLQSVIISKNVRQKDPTYRDAVNAIADGDIELGFDKLDRQGRIQQLAEDKRYETIAHDYAEITQKQGQSALVISPTHKEGKIVTSAIRMKLKDDGTLGDSRLLTMLENTQWTQAQRSQASSYTMGQVVEFHQNVKGFKRGERAVVTATDECAVTVMKRNGDTATLNLEQAERFQVYLQQRIEVAKGERIRITQGGRAMDRQYHLKNGTFHTVNRFDEEGNIVLSNGKKMSAQYGHLSHGYTSTSVAAQGATVDKVLVAHSQKSVGAGDLRQFYVSASRGKHDLRIYCDDKHWLKQTVSELRQRDSATDLIGGRQLQLHKWRTRVAGWRRWLVNQSQRFQNINQASMRREHEHGNTKSYSR